jgi:IS5 family transposase
MPGNPYDGHTAAEQIEQVEILTGERPKTVLADRGYKGAQIPGCRLLLAHTRKLPKRLKRLLKRRNAIEPMIGHMKNDGLLRRNWLKGSLGDAMHAVLCGAGHNMRLILAHLRVLYCALFGFAALAMLALSSPPKSTELQLGRAN